MLLGAPVFGTAALTSTTSAGYAAAPFTTFYVVPQNAAAPAFAMAHPPASDSSLTAGKPRAGGTFRSRLDILLSAVHASLERNKKLLEQLSKANIQKEPLST